MKDVRVHVTLAGTVFVRQYNEDTGRFKQDLAYLKATNAAKLIVSEKFGCEIPISEKNFERLSKTNAVVEH